MRNVIIYGETDFAERIYSYIVSENKLNVLAFTNAKNFKEKDMLWGLPVVAFEDLNKVFKDIDFEIIIAIGYVQMNSLRRKIFEECRNAGYTIGTYVSTTAVIYQSDIEEGCIIMPNCYIGPRCHIGKCNIFEACVNLSHDNNLGEFNFISTNTTIGGHTTVGNNCFIGLNCTIKNDVVVNDYSLIGSAANVLHTTKVGKVYIGNPARELEDKSSLSTKI